jgi:hypothetical protein
MYCHVFLFFLELYIFANLFLANYFISWCWSSRFIYLCSLLFPLLLGGEKILSPFFNWCMVPTHKPFCFSCVKKQFIIYEFPWFVPIYWIVCVIYNMISRVVWDIQFVTSCYKLFVVNLLTTCYVRTTSDFLLEQFVAILLASSTLLQDDNNLFQICQQLGSSIANISCWQAVRFLRV